VKLISWNVNGLRAVLRKNFLDYLATEDPDILCLQETRSGPDDVEQLWPATYTTSWNVAQKKGYSGTALFTKVRPLNVVCGIGCLEHDCEGRVITAEYDDFFVISVYVPNSQRQLARHAYRQQWDRDFRECLATMARKKPIIVCGDLNVAHTELDIANPKANLGRPGFTLEERAGFGTLLESGFIDTFREFEQGGGYYTWWSPLTDARARNIGWRIDYVLISSSLRPRLQQAFIRSTIPGSDHCPVGIVLS
jgi:exodeoxyribonuclease-3